MKRVLLAFCLILPFVSQAQKRHEYTFDFTQPQNLRPAIQLPPVDQDYNGAEIDLRNYVFKSSDDMVSVSFVGRSDDGRGGVLKTGWLQDDETYDHYLFVGRSAKMLVTGNGAELDSLIFSKNSFVGNLRLVSPTGIGLVDPTNESWFSQGTTGVTQLEYINYGQLPEIRSFTVIYRSPLDVLAVNSIAPANGSKVHAINTIELSFSQPVKIGGGARFELSGPVGFNPVQLNASVVGSRVILSLPDGVVIDESIEARRGTYTLVVGEKSVITNDEDGYYNKRTVYTFDVVEAYDKFVPDIIWPDMAEDAEKIDTIVVGFPDYIRKFSAENLKLVDRDGSVVRNVQAKWLEADEYTADRSFFRGDRDISKYLQFVFSGDMKAAVKASGIYYLTIPQGFIWNSKYDATAEDEGISVGARFNPEITITYNVNGVVYPSDEVLQAAKDLLAITGAGYPAADSPARIALQNLVTEGIGADAVFEEAMNGFYAETMIEMPKDGYYLLSAVSPEGTEVYVSYEDDILGLTRKVEDAAHLLAQVNEDGTLVFETPDHKYLTRLAPTGSNITSTYNAKQNNFTFSKLEVEGKTPQELFGLWIINAWLRSTEEEVDKTAYALVNFQTNTFATSDERENRYFDEVLSNAFRLTETDEPIPAATYSFDPVSGTALETLYRVELTFTNINEVKMVENAKTLITLVGSNALKYSPNLITAVSGTKNKFVLSFDDVKAGSYTLTIPKGVFSWTYGEREAVIPEITANYVVKSGVDFSYDFIFKNTVYYYKKDLNVFVRDIDMNELVLMVPKKFTWGISNKQVLISDADDIKTYATGHFVPYPEFSDPDYVEASAIKLVLDNPIKRGDMLPGVYNYVIAPATFGDENFAKWLADPQSYSKNDCHVNSLLRPNISVDNDKANMSFTPVLNSYIDSFSEVTFTFPYATNVTVAEGKKLTIQNTFDNSEIDATIEPVEGKKNAFRFTSTERLKFGTWEGEYMITVPVGMFHCTDAIGDFIVPSAYELQFWFYGRYGGDGIQSIDNGQLTMDNATIYDLSGRRVNNTSKPGIYIVNGKKVVVK